MADQRDSVAPNPLSVSQYEVEKANGTRLPNGARPLKKLKPRHLQVIRLHLEGLPNRRVAQQLGMTDSQVSLILSDPLTRPILARASEQWDLEFDALYGLHLDALREGLQSGDVRDRIRAASVYGRERLERRKQDTGGSESAEDVIARMLQLNIQVNVGGAE